MLKRFHEIRDETITFSRKNTVINVNTRKVFIEQSIHLEEMLQKLNICVLELRKENSRFHNCRYIFDAQVDIISEQKQKLSSPVDGCKLMP